jgi:hypothetical protein
MKNKLIYIVAFLSSIIYASEEVKELNYTLSSNLYDSSYLSTKSIIGTVNIPLNTNISAKLSAGYSDNLRSYISKSKYNYLSSEFFYRYRTGKAGVEYKVSEEKINSEFLYVGSLLNIKTKNTLIYLNRYINDNFTIITNINYYETEILFYKDYDNYKYDGKYYNIGGSWYFQDTKATFFYGNNFKNDYKSYALNFAYQPELFKNSVEIVLECGINDYAIDSVSIYARYHFSKTKLKNRDREYR